MNKKAQTSHTVIKSITWFFFLIIILLSITFLVKSYIRTVIDTKDIEADLFYQEMLFTNNGITYQDEITSRNYPGIIDIDNFNLDTLNKSINYGPENYFIAADFNLRYLDGTLIKSFVYNEKWYDRWKPLTKKYLPGSGSADIVFKQIYVLVKQEEVIFPAILQVEIVYPNK